MKARIAAKLAAARDREPAPSGSTEPHYNPNQIAEFWGISASQVRRIFRDVPGVMRVGCGGTRRAHREYFSIRIPKSVLDRVHAEFCR